MGQVNSAFTPYGMSNQSVAPASQAVVTLSTGVQQVALPSRMQLQGGTLRIVADGGTGLAWCYGTNANLTIDNGEFMLPNSAESFSIDPGYATISIIGLSASGKARVHFGEGY